MSFPVVTKDDHGIRPAGSPEHCFYCSSAVGEEHKKDCVVVHKLVKIRATIEIEIEVPHSWTKEDIEFHRNESSWCAQNLQNDIDKYRESTNSCMCQETKIEVLEVVDETPMITRDGMRKKEA